MQQADLQEQGLTGAEYRCNFFYMEIGKKIQSFPATHAKMNIFPSEEGVRFENTLANKKLVQSRSAGIKEEM